MFKTSKISKIIAVVTLTIALFIQGVWPVGAISTTSVAASSLPDTTANQSGLLQTGNTWYTATTGDDANDCATNTTPCASINGALAKPGFVSGDTCCGRNLYRLWL